MSESPPDRRLIENEVVFRQENERVQKYVSDNPDRKYKKNKLHFLCECANEDCRERIVMSPPTYKKMHENERRFVIKPGHNVASIERIVKNRSDYCVVEKLFQPPKSVSRLNPSAQKT